MFMWMSEVIFLEDPCEYVAVDFVSDKNDI